MGIIRKYDDNPYEIITVLSNGANFAIDSSMALAKYSGQISDFIKLVRESSSSADLLFKIRSPGINANTRMTYLKLFRRCVCSSLDTELSKKINAVSTETLVTNFSEHFLDISELKNFFNKDFTYCHLMSLSCLLAEYDKRGTSGYQLTDLLFNQLESLYPNVDVLGPRGAGKDIELNTVYPSFTGGKFPCDFVIKEKRTEKVLAVGFSRYDSTRGGAQSDDRTGGNAQKVSKLREHFALTGEIIKVLFVSDGPGLAHNDTWEETLNLDESWDDNVRVTTLKTLEEVTQNWLIVNYTRESTRSLYSL